MLINSLSYVSIENLLKFYFYTRIIDISLIVQIPLIFFHIKTINMHTDKEFGHH